MQETQEMWVWSLSWEDPLKKEMATHSSILAWKISRAEEASSYTPQGLKESDTTEPHPYPHTLHSQKVNKFSK